MDAKFKSSGPLRLNNGYTVVQTVYHKKANNYMPYVVGCIIRGPKGGYYALDTFGLQQLRQAFGLELQQGVQVALKYKNGIGIVSECLVANRHLLDAHTNEDAMKAYAKSYGYKYIKRKESHDFVSKIVKNKDLHVDTSGSMDTPRF